MALLNNQLTLLEVAKRLDPNGQIRNIAELLQQTNDVLLDLQYKEANGINSHTSTVRTSLPTVNFKKLNEGTPISSSTTATIEERLGILEAFSQADESLVDSSGNPAAYRLSEAVSFLSAMSQKAAETFFYGNASINPEEFNGLAQRYNGLTGSEANTKNVINAGGTGADNMSIWLVGHGEEGLSALYPKGSQVGLQRKDLGVNTVTTIENGVTKKLRAYEEQFKWCFGISVKNWQNCVRIANIDVSNLAGGSAADLQDLMIEAHHKIANQNSVNLAFYMNRTAFSYLDKQRVGKTDGNVGWENIDGKIVYNFRGIPIRKCDVLTVSEAALS